jgi:hypothetical protein
MGPSWEATSWPVTQEFLNILWNPKVYYFVHKSGIGPDPESDEFSPYHSIFL